MSPILVTGATGNVGRAVVRELAARGAAVRALAHTTVPADLPAGVEVVRGDLTDPASLEPALSGAGAVFLLWPSADTATAPAGVDAVGRHARRVGYLSSMSVRDDVAEQADPISTFHAELERLIEDATPEWTFLRAGGFATNTLAWADDLRAGDVVRGPYGSMARSLIHEKDIAAVAVRALTEDGHAGARHTLTGPEAVTQEEQVRLIGEAVGRPLRFEQIPPSRARRRMLDQGWPVELADAVLGGWAAMAREPEPVTDTVERVTGEPARTLGRWALDHAADFGAR